MRAAEVGRCYIRAYIGAWHADGEWLPVCARACQHECNAWAGASALHHEHQECTACACVRVYCMLHRSPMQVVPEGLRARCDQGGSGSGDALGHWGPTCCRAKHSVKTQQSYRTDLIDH